MRYHEVAGSIPAASEGNVFPSSSSVAQMVRALVLCTGGREFDPRQNYSPASNMDGAGQASLATLLARGPQDSFMLGTDGLTPNFVQYSDFSIDQTSYTFGSAPYLGTLQTFSITPKQIPGDLLTNAFLVVTLPNIYPGVYIEQVGRGITKQVSMYLNEVEIETLYDDWYIIRDQLFLDADEQSLMSNVINVSSLYIPLDFSWCRRISKSRSDHRKPMFPICAAYNQTLYIKIQMASMPEISSNLSSLDLVSPPILVLETVKLTDVERNYYMRGTEITVNHVYKEPVNSISTQLTNMNLTANFPVSLITWFIRKNLNTGDPLYYLKRFNFSYLTNPNITLQNVDIFEYIYMFVNNENITSRFTGQGFYKYLQPLYSNISTPVKDIYMYSFGLRPNEYNQGGALDFSKADSSTSTLSFKVNNLFLTDISLNYTINMYYYGYIKLKFSGGYCTLQVV